MFDIVQGQYPGVTGSDYGFQSSVIFKDLKKEKIFKCINANLFNATNTDTSSFLNKSLSIQKDEYVNTLHTTEI